MEYYGIKVPKTEYDEPYIYWIADGELNSWQMFFKNANPHRAPLSTAIEAYEAIGYKCVKLNIKEIEG